MTPLFSSFEIILPVFNEESRIKAVIPYLKQWAPLLIVDNYSSDSTIEIVKIYLDNSTRFLQVANNGAGQTSEWTAEVLSYSSRNYVVFSSCSEFISPQLFAYFNKLASASEIHIVSTPIDSYTCGFYLPLWGGSLFSRSRYVERFFHKEAVDIEAIRIHAPYVVKHGYSAIIAPKFIRHYPIVHLRDSDWQTLTNKHLGYAIVEANQRKRDHNRLTKLKLLNLLCRELVRLIRGAFIPNVPYFIVFREIASRIFMHISIYIIGVESEFSLGLSYSRARSNELREQITTSNTSEFES